MNLSTFDSFKSHPLISQLFTNQELKQEFLQSISSIPIQAEKNQQLLEMLSSNTLLPQFTQGIKSNCEQRIEKILNQYCALIAQGLVTSQKRKLKST